MLIIKKKLIFSLGEVWFDEEPEKINDVDILYYWHSSQPIKNAYYKEFYTRLIDLTKSQNELWESLSSNDRYKIRRAEQKDDIVYEYWDEANSDIIKEFCDFYDDFALQKGLDKIKRLDLVSRINAGKINLSRVTLKDGTGLVWHNYYRIKNRVLLLHSASIKNKTDTAYQSLLGRANRFHHWQDMMKFKSLGISIYDFGGWYMGNTDEEKLRLNDFKKKFGGEVANNFNCSRGITIKGKAYLYLQHLYRNLKPYS